MKKLQDDNRTVNAVTDVLIDAIKDPRSPETAMNLVHNLWWLNVDWLNNVLEKIKSETAGDKKILQLISDTIESRIDMLTNHTLNNNWWSKKGYSPKPHNPYRKSWFTKLLEKKARKKSKLSWYQKTKLKIKELDQAISDYNKTKKVKKDYKQDLYDRNLDQIQLESNMVFSKIRNKHLEENWDMIYSHDVDYEQKAEHLKKLLDDTLELSKDNNEIRVHLQSLSDDLEVYLKQNNANIEKDRIETLTKIKKSHEVSLTEQESIKSKLEQDLRGEKSKQYKDRLVEETKRKKVKNQNKKHRAQVDFENAEEENKQSKTQKDDTHKTNIDIRENTNKTQKAKYQKRKNKTQEKVDNIATQTHKAKEFSISQVKTAANKTRERAKSAIKGVFKRKYEKETK